METVWTPPALLPQSGAVWRQAGPDQAEVRFPGVPGVEPLHLTLDSDGRVLEMTTLRWSNANPDRIYRLLPFVSIRIAPGRPRKRALIRCTLPPRQFATRVSWGLTP